VVLAVAPTLVRWAIGDGSDLLAVGLGAVATVAVLTRRRDLDRARRAVTPNVASRSTSTWGDGSAAAALLVGQPPRALTARE
jgi:hypothetical protein